jgi:hypothetical protein
MNGVHDDSVGAARVTTGESLLPAFGDEALAIATVLIHS